ncbi:MAG: hypothetical protein HY744_08885 [Deltaproteobacteria bacterium]|nr:hypothetical protein [Deltaproteobacteria bacterium]
MTDPGVLLEKLARRAGAGRDLPPALRAIARAIEESRAILNLEADFDGAGSPACSQKTWERAVGFLRRHAIAAYERDGTAIDVPHIGAGPGGSIDIHWESASHELLVNIPADPVARAELYGDDKATICIKGTLDPGSCTEGLVAWLTKRPR